MMLETTTSGGERPLVAVNSGGADNEARASWLLCRTGGITCALPIENVSEIMRPLPIEQIAGAPEYILGLSVIRGAPVPVADLGAIVSGRKTRPARLIAARAATGKIALAVQAVTGVATIGLDACRDLPPLLRDAATDTIAAIGAGDSGLIMFLQTARLLPDELIERRDADGAAL